MPDAKEKKLFCVPDANQSYSCYFGWWNPPKILRWRFPWVLDLIGDNARNRLLHILLFALIAAEIIFFNNLIQERYNFCLTEDIIRHFPTVCQWATPTLQNLTDSQVIDEHAAYYARNYAVILGQHVVLCLYYIFPWFPMFIANAYSSRLCVCLLAIGYLLFQAALHISGAFGYYGSYGVMIRELQSIYNTATDTTRVYYYPAVLLIVEYALIVTLFAALAITWAIHTVLTWRESRLLWRTRREDAMRLHVKMLLDPKFKRRRLADEAEVYAHHVASLATKLQYPKWKKTLFKVLALIKTSIVGQPTPKNWHEPFESTYFFWPLRLIFACVFSLTYGTAFLAVVWVSVQRLYDIITRIMDSTSVMLHENGLGAISGAYPVIATAMKAIVYTTASVLFMAQILMWLLIFRSYRRKMMLLRQGKYWFDKMDFPLFRFVEYISIQAFSFVVFFGATLAIVIATAIFALSYHYVPEFNVWVRNGLLDLLFDILVLVLTVRITSIVFFRFYCSSGSGRYLRNRRLIAFGEAIALYAYIPLAVFQTALRLIFAIVFQYVTFPLLYMSSCPRSFEGWDSGHRAFTAMLLADHLTNNAIVKIFVRSLWKPVKRRRHQTNDLLDTTYKMPPDERKNAMFNLALRLRQQRFTAAEVKTPEMTTTDQHQQQQQSLSAVQSPTVTVVQAPAGTTTLGYPSIASPTVTAVSHTAPVTPTGRIQTPLPPAALAVSSAMAAHALSAPVTPSHGMNAAAAFGRTSALPSAPPSSPALSPDIRPQYDYQNSRALPEAGINEEYAFAALRSHRARLRWHLYYTLVHNPQLVDTRRPFPFVRPTLHAPQLDNSQQR
eukprot:TRINITY_DN6193_c0_g1_i1.p1 TRINITY_DN6193_c0_g1~~TRINITY_DN6193_c0_g1_i1.p1  ORF type:complete len:837 (+),score=162.93 TRINITY_DN6193_c0_g1_i1:49-2559(+)